MKKYFLTVFILFVGLNVYGETQIENDKVKFKSCTPGVYLNKSVKVYGKDLLILNCKFGMVTHITPDGRLIDQILCVVPMLEMNKYVDMYINSKYNDSKFLEKYHKYCHGDALEIAR